MSLTAPGIKGVATDFMGATPSATVVFQAVPAPWCICTQSESLSLNAIREYIDKKLLTFDPFTVIAKVHPPPPHSPIDDITQ